MKILITGVAGFIGSKVAEKFLKNDHEVFGVDDLSQGKIENIPSKIKFIKYDLSDEKILNILPKECDYILHIAGQSSGEISFDNPKNDLEKNTLSTLNLIKYGVNKKVKKFLYASSMSVYGQVEDHAVSETHVTNPISCYGISKLTSERYLELFSDKLSYINLRMFNVYGPGQDLKNLRQGMVSIFLAQALKKNKILVKGSVERFRDFIFINDVVEIWYNLTFNKECKNLNINVASGQRITVKELLKKIIDFYPKTKFYSEGNTPGDQTGIFASIKLLKSYYDVSSLYPLEKGLKQFFKWVEKKK